MFKKLLTDNKIIGFFVVILLISLFVGIVVSAKVNSSLNQKIVDIKEEQRPANLEIVIIKNSSCVECFDFTGVIDVIKKYNVDILSEKSIEYDSVLGQELIADNRLNSLPFFILKGELDKEPELKKLLAQFGVSTDDTFVATKIPAPYFSLASNEIFGKTNLVMLSDDTCLECYDVTNHRVIMKNFGVYVEKEEVLSIQTDRGRQLMDQYKIDLLPTIILSGDVEAYSSITSIWGKVGTVEDDGSFIFRQGVKSMGIYKDVAGNKIVDPNNKLNELK